ncbi:MAG: choice-of-anchor V domain-containing protein [candidate division Zixibacteria bacterium]
MKAFIRISTICCLLISSSLVFARANYIGYSGAPGCMGRCASSCHENSGGTIQIDGFPSEYIPGETYTIAVSHSGGSSIKQFNGSCRVGRGSEDAGVISAGTNTSTYSRSEETNGVRFSSNNRNSGTFDWTAPVGGTGEVRLYVAGLQGGYGGQNSTLSLISDESMTDIRDESSTAPSRFALKGNYPNPFNATTIIEFALPEPSHITIEIYDILGRAVETLYEGERQAGYHQVIWNANSVSSGVYYYRIWAGAFSETKRMVLLR